jgi:GT2 family glycosyltransferase
VNRTSWEKLAILIPTRNRPEILATTLAELRKIGMGETALWVYDDASDDEEAIRETVARNWPNGSIIRGEKRVGQAEGRNALMQACRKEYGLFLDDDSFPASSDGLARHLNPDTRPVHRAVTTFQYKSMADGRLSTNPAVQSGTCVSFLGGGSIFHIPSVLAVGGFRKFFVYGYEEPELAMRLWLKGYEIWYDPDVVISHNHFETPNECRDHREYDYLYARNGILMSSLNLPLWFGLPHGLARSFRRSLHRRRNFGAKAGGTLAGLWLSLTLWRERTPCQFKKALAWCRHIKGTRT